MFIVPPIIIQDEKLILRNLGYETPTYAKAIANPGFEILAPYTENDTASIVGKILIRKHLVAHLSQENLTFHAECQNHSSETPTAHLKIDSLFDPNSLEFILWEIISEPGKVTFNFTRPRAGSLQTADITVLSATLPHPHYVYLQIRLPATTEHQTFYYLCRNYISEHLDSAKNPTLYLGQASLGSYYALPCDTDTLIQQYEVTSNFPNLARAQEQS